jgi:hypothetical protein
MARPVLRRGEVSGFVAPRLQISCEYAPSSRLARRRAALAIPCPIYFQNALLYHLQKTIGRLERNANFLHTPPLPNPLLQTECGREGDDAQTDATTSLNIPIFIAIWY